MRNQKDRVIIDTNLWISFLLTNILQNLIQLLPTKKLLLFSAKN